MTRTRVWAGAALAVLAALMLSGTSVSAVVSYGGGANPEAIMVIRFAGAVAVLYGLLRLTRTPLRLAPRTRLLTLSLGLAQAGQGWFLYTSLDHIPVGLTMIIFYVYPLLVGLIAAALGQERLTWTLGAGLVAAFAGLTLVFNVTGAGLNLTGAATAIGAAVFWSLVVVFTARLAGPGDTRPVTFHVQLSALAFVALYLLASGNVALPDSAAAWAAYLLVPVLYGLGVTAFFVAASMVGSIRASLIMNSEAVFAIILGYLVLGQMLTPLQLVGGGIVLLALGAARWDPGRVAGRA